MHTIAVSAFTLIAAATVSAQTCQPEWDTTSGNPGIADGYIAPITPWDDGNGERLYVGGSFKDVGGTPYDYLAVWDRATGNWSNLGRGIQSSFVTSILPFDPGTGEQLVVAGAFTGAGNVPGTRDLAMWDGTSWSDLGSNLTGGSIWSMTEWNGSLYVGGRFDDIGGVFGGGVASWDGASWSDLGTGVFGNFNPYVASMIVFDDGTGEQLYAAGRFDGIGNVTTSLIARWDGNTWSRVGVGLTPTSTLFGIEAMTIFDDGSGPALYVAGYSFFTPTGGPVNVAKWDGQSWSDVGQEVGTGRLTSMVVYDDGSGPELVVGGTAMPGINYLARLETNTWVPLDGGVGSQATSAPWPSVFGLGLWDGALYVGGNFSQVGFSTGALLSAEGLAAHTTCLQSCYPDCDQSTGAGVLDIFDFLCFQNSFVNGESYACNCDTSTGPGVCDVFDFLCFQNAFVGGCP